MWARCIIAGLILDIRQIGILLCTGPLQTFGVGILSAAGQRAAFRHAAGRQKRWQALIQLNCSAATRHCPELCCGVEGPSRSRRVIAADCLSFVVPGIQSHPDHVLVLLLAEIGEVLDGS